MSSSQISSLFISLSLLIIIQVSDATKMYNSCAPFNCGNVTNITFPFWSSNTQPKYCGHPNFDLNCQNETLTLDMMSQRFQILRINRTSQLLSMRREDLSLDAAHPPCPLRYINVGIDLNFFHYTTRDENYTLLSECGLMPNPLLAEVFDIKNCYKDGNNSFSYLVLSRRVFIFKSLECKHNISLVGLKPSFTRKYIDDGFEVRWSGVDDDKICDRCMKSGKRCGYKASTKKVMCLSTGAWNWKKILIVCAVSVFATLVVITAIYLYHRQTNSNSTEANTHSIGLTAQTSRLGSQRLERDQNFGVQHFTCSELEEATDNFSSLNFLGDGGFAAVYKGELHDGRMIAVKRLYEHNYNRLETFINEVQNLSKLDHPNLVRLYGCTSSHSRELLLVYEYVLNGTVDEHLHGSRAKDQDLNWTVRMNIALETASALKYLHASTIIHRDIKTSNILLDTHLHAKVADFGLSRHFQTTQSHVSTGPQGTRGYMDPKYHRSYVLTKKSDVFSFGVVLIELISSLLAVDITRHSGEINLYEMAINKIQSQALQDLVDPTLGFESNSKVAEMVNGVAELAFRCLQSSQELRPDMEEVLKTLQDIQRNGSSQPQPSENSGSDDDDDNSLLRRDSLSHGASYYTAPSAIGSG